MAAIATAGGHGAGESAAAERNRARSGGPVVHPGACRWCAGCCSGSFRCSNMRGPRLGTVLRERGRTASAEPGAASRAQHAGGGAGGPGAGAADQRGADDPHASQSLRNVQPGFATPDHSRPCASRFLTTLVPEIRLTVTRMQNDVLDKISRRFRECGPWALQPISSPMDGNDRQLGSDCGGGMNYRQTEKAADPAVQIRVAGLLSDHGSRLLAGRDFSWEDVYQHAAVGDGFGELGAGRLGLGRRRRSASAFASSQFAVERSHWRGARMCASTAWTRTRRRSSTGRCCRAVYAASRVIRRADSPLCDSHRARGRQGFLRSCSRRSGA